MAMNRLYFLMMREELMVRMEGVITLRYGENDEAYDHHAELCDLVCEIMDPAGLGDPVLPL